MTSVRCVLVLPEPTTQLELRAFDGKHFRFLSERAFAPGQPLKVTAALAAPVALELKSLGSMRCADGRYELRARAATLRREARAALLAAFSDP